MIVSNTSGGRVICHKTTLLSPFCFPLISALWRHSNRTPMQNFTRRVASSCARKAMRVGCRHDESVNLTALKEWLSHHELLPLLSLETNTLSGPASAQGDPPKMYFRRAFCGGTESGQTQLQVDRSSLQETLDTGLFSSRGPQRMGWAHQTFAEFLAARYCRKHNMPTQQLQSSRVSSYTAPYCPSVARSSRLDRARQRGTVRRHYNS